MGLMEKAAAKFGIRLDLVKLEFTSCGEVMIDGLPFSFGVESLTGSSDMGLSVSFSGEAIDKGLVTLSGFERRRMVRGHRESVKVDLPLVVKKDGKRIYLARFEGLPVHGREGRSLHNATKEELLNSVEQQIDFCVTPHYEGTDVPEIMLSVYPFENPLNGSATKWLGVTADKDYFVHRLESIERIRDRRRKKKT